MLSYLYSYMLFLDHGLLINALTSQGIPSTSSEDNNNEDDDSKQHSHLWKGCSVICLLNGSRGVYLIGLHGWSCGSVRVLYSKHQQFQRSKECSVRGLELLVATFGRGIELKLSALDDLDLLQRPVHWARGHVFDLLYDIIALEHFAEDDVAAIKPTVQTTNQPFTF